MNPETSNFIKEHLTDDIHRLALQSARYPLVDMDFAIRQIAGKQKIKAKIPLFYQTENILFPQQLSLEQSSSESTAKYKSTLCEGKTFADITGGFGIDCYFISRKFSEAVYVERNEELCQLTTHNFRQLGADNIEVIHADGVDFLNKTPKVDCIFIDPARRGKGGNKVFRLSDCEPDLEQIYSLLCEKASQIVVKLSPMLDIQLALKSLPGTKEVHIISVENECKELVFVIHNQIFTKTKIRAINITKEGEYRLFEYFQQEENDCLPEFATQPGQYLYEPNTSILKAGAFKLISKRFEAQKLNKNTHLYTSDHLNTEFPGRIFEIIEVTGNSKAELKKLKTNYPKANINTRNYPLSVAEFRKKTGITEGGDIFIFACKNMKEENIMIIAKKINQEK